MRVLISALVASSLLTAGCSSQVSSSDRPTRGATPGVIPLAPLKWTVTQGGDNGIPGWLDGVDCVTATRCVAVGTTSPTGGAGSANALVETMNKGSWTSSIAPEASNIPGDWLFSVSCATVASCVAVGYYFTLKHGGSASMLIETLANGTWTVSSPPPLGSDVQDSFLNGVSCTQPTNCVAVGETLSSKYIPRPLIISLAHGRWSVASSPSLGPDSGGLQSVSCVQSSLCVAVGYMAHAGTSNNTLVEALQGGQWMIAPSPGSGRRGAGFYGLSAVSCVAPSSCVAVGRMAGPVIEEGSNGSWSSLKTPPTPGDAGSGLYGLWCKSARSCLAVGELASASAASSGSTPDGAFASPLGALIETSSGTTWAIDPGPPGPPQAAGLHAVSCAGGACVAVGQSAQTTGTGESRKTLIMEGLYPGDS